MRIKSHKNYFNTSQYNNYQHNRFAPKAWWTPQQQPQPQAVAQPVSAKVIQLRARKAAPKKAATPIKPKAKSRRTAAPKTKRK